MRPFPTGRAGRTLATLTALAAVTAGLAGCGNDTTTSTGTSAASTSAAPTSSVDPALAAKVPAAVKAAGTIAVGTDSTYAPSEFLAADGKTIEGFDVDLFTAVAAKLGLKATFQSALFDSIIPGISSGKYGIGVSSFTINADRKKTVDMVSYFNAGTQWVTKKGNAAGVSVDNACGKHVAVQKTTVQADDIAARSTKCTGAGKKAITVDIYQGQDQATASVVSGKDDAMLADYPVGAWAVKQSNGALALLGDVYAAAPYGYVIKKGQGEFGQALAGAVTALISDGSYLTILKKWNVQAGAITTPAVNP